MLPRKAKYSIRAILYLARRRGEGPVQIQDIAEAEKIPRKFLEAILVELRNEGLLQSRKGKGGGYSLERPLDSISMGRLIRLMDGPLALVPCVSQTAYSPCEDCLDERSCAIRHIMKQVRDATSKILDSTSFEVLEQIQAQSMQCGPGWDFTI